ncbi:MAG: GntR family transcriptional regulator [Oscillospiraceae bacterium]
MNKLILNSDTSIFLQIRNVITDGILRDIFCEETRVPSTNELAEMYKINPATAAKGINLLVDEGILYKKRGVGMFVATGAKTQIITKRKEQFFDSFVKNMVNEAKNLNIARDELVEMIDKANENKENF